MSRFAALRPRRSLVLPLLMALFPILYFAYREVGRSCRPGRSCPEIAIAGYALVGIAASYLLACAALALVDVRALAADHSVARLAFRPADATLSVLGVLVAGIAVYTTASLVAPIPPWLDGLLTPVGLVVGLPFVATAVTMTVVGSALSVEPSMPVQLAVVAGSLVATGAWVFLLATGVAGVLDRARVVGPKPG